MTITPGELLDVSVAQLRTLAAFLGEQLSESGGRRNYAMTEARVCNEIHRSLQRLIARAQAGVRGEEGSDQTIV